jgi:hypothetical protein
MGKLWSQLAQCVKKNSQQKRCYRFTKESTKEIGASNAKFAWRHLLKVVSIYMSIWLKNATKIMNICNYWQVSVDQCTSIYFRRLRLSKLPLDYSRNQSIL